MVFSQDHENERMACSLVFFLNNTDFFFFKNNLSIRMKNVTMLSFNRFVSMVTNEECTKTIILIEEISFPRRPFKL